MPVASVVGDAVVSVAVSAGAHPAKPSASIADAARVETLVSVEIISISPILWRVFPAQQESRFQSKRREKLIANRMKTSVYNLTSDFDSRTSEVIPYERLLNGRWIRITQSGSIMFEKYSSFFRESAVFD
jgi:hypothetical protein